VFAQIYYLQGAGGLRSETDLLGTHIYNLGIGQSSYGMASAVAIFMLVLTLVLTIGYVRKLAKED
jgi:N,N'-diacetylchitobiose transport system permease protein